MRSLGRKLVWLCVLLCPGTVFGDEWSIDGTQYPPTPPENRIIRWCSADGTKERFASANIQLKGYEPCGQLRARATCDAAGTKLFSNDPNVPYDHRDCAAGPRIMVISHNPPPVEPVGMNEPEIGNASFRKEFKQLQRKREEEEKREIQNFVDAIFSHLLGPDASFDRKRGSGISRRPLRTSSRSRSGRGGNGAVEIEIYFDPRMLLGQLP